MLESFYGQDLDSGHHGSGFPLPPFRQRLLEEHLQKQAAARGSKAAPRTDSDTGEDHSKRMYTQEETVYSEHSWNINNLPRCKVRCSMDRTEVSACCCGGAVIFTILVSPVDH